MSDYTVQGSIPVYRKAYPIKEKQTGIYAFTMKDEAGAVIPAASLTSLTLTVYSLQSGAIVNSRNAQNVLNANNVSVSEGGVVTWIQQIADVTILNDALTEETHRCLFVFGWNSGGNPRSYPHELDLVIENLGKLT